MKLNLGCRNRKIEGFTGIDCDPHPGVDIVSDASELGMFKDNSVEEIFASHILEHFPHTKTRDVLKEWHRVLNDDGILYVAVPDFKRTVEIYQKMGKLSPWIINYLCGDQEYKTAFHYCLFDHEYLSKMLLDIGFKEASQVEDFPIGDPMDCSRNVSNLDGKSVSLNIIAIK